MSHMSNVHWKLLLVLYDVAHILALVIEGHVSEGVGEEFEMVKGPDGQDLENILNKPPDDTVDPHPQRHSCVVAESQAHDGKTIEAALGPKGGKEGGDGEGDEDGHHQGLAGRDRPEESLLGAARKEGEEVGERNLEVESKN